jgi:hypothetical protein
MPSASLVQDALLRTDLGVLLDRDVLVGLEGGHDIIGDLGAIIVVSKVHGLSTHGSQDGRT